MKLSEGRAALISGAGSGIGRALALHFAQQGVSITVVDFSSENGIQTVDLIRQELSQGAGESIGKPRAIFCKCDVSRPEDLVAAFKQHMQTFGRLDVCVNNAGIGDREWFLNDSSEDGMGQWRHVINVNLLAVIDGTRLAVRAMQAGGQPGVVLNIASAAGLYPSTGGPVYSASKGGVVLFTRSLAHLNRIGLRVNALCPEYIETPLVSQVSGAAAKHLPGVIRQLGGFIPMPTIVQGVMELIEDDSKAGECLWITNRRGKQYWPTAEEKKRYEVPMETTRKGGGSETEEGVPSTLQKIQVLRLSTDFRAATELVSHPLPLPLPGGSILVKYRYAGINASDVNYSAGRYFGSRAEAEKKLPFDAGFEGVGVVAACGGAVRGLKVGDPVATLNYGAFSTFSVVDAKLAIPIESPTPQMVALLTSGLTASIALEQAGRMESGQTVLVTAAAGGTGQFAVQVRGRGGGEGEGPTPILSAAFVPSSSWQKLAGNTVIATCGGPEKAAVLRALGVDRVIDYKAESVAQVLKAEYPGGVDVVYESVGGEMFGVCLRALARFGRCVVIGMMSQYRSGEGQGWEGGAYPGLAEKLLWKSQTVFLNPRDVLKPKVWWDVYSCMPDSKAQVEGGWQTGFFLIHYASLWRRHLSKLYALYKAGHLQVAIDPTPFVGLAKVADAVEYLQSGNSRGKVVVQIEEDGVLSEQQSRL